MSSEMVRIAREATVVRMAKLVRVACAERGLMLGRRDQDGEGGQSDEGDQGSQ